MARAGLVLGLFLGLASSASGAEMHTTHGLSLFGDLKYPENFQHFDYVNPAAPKGGEARLYDLQGFDSLNPFIIKGKPALGTSLTYDTLLKPSSDEPFAEYGLLAQSITLPEDKSYVIFALRPEARFHDGSPVRASDVVFSFDILKEKGLPQYRSYYANVSQAIEIDPLHVKFTFSVTGNRELPVIVGEVPVLPKKYWQAHNFEQTTLEPPLTSGPYRIARVDQNRSITYERVKDYWGADLPVNRGQHNFDRITYESFSDRETSLQGLFADVYDFRVETSMKTWAHRYDTPPVKKGLIIREKIKLHNPQPMQGMVFNLRRSKFADPRVRLALDYAFDFDWINTHLSTGEFRRTESYFANSELTATDLPGPLELELLEPFRAQLPPELFTTPYHAPKTDGSGDNRDNLRKARALLEQAGWIIKNGVLTNAKTGEVMRIELVQNDDSFAADFQVYCKSLQKLAVQCSMRVVDDAQYIERLNRFDFDMTISVLAQSLSPGNEQREYWGSQAADRPGSRNLGGIKNPVIDALVDKVIFAADRAHQVAATRALDRVLLWNHYIVSQWYSPEDKLAYWDRFGKPAVQAPYAIGFPDNWWYDAARAAKTGAAKN